MLNFADEALQGEVGLGLGLLFFMFAIIGVCTETSSEFVLGLSHAIIVSGLVNLWGVRSG